MSDPDHPSSDIDRNTPAGLAIDVVLFAVGLMMLLPLVFLISNAFKTPPELLAWPPTIIPDRPTLENILGVLHETPLLHWIGNTLVFAALSTASIVSTSAIAGYVLGKFDLPWFPAVFGIIIATSVVPVEVYMIPLYLNVQAAGLLNTLPGLLVGYLVMSFGIFLVRQYVTTSIPDELLEAARVDGAGEGWIFLRIVLPLMRGPLGALAVLAFFQAWTAFAWPLVVTTNKDTYTLEVGLALFQTGFTVDIGHLSAAAALALVPSALFFSLMRRNFVRGVAGTGLKE